MIEFYLDFPEDLKQTAFQKITEQLTGNPEDKDRITLKDFEISAAVTVDYQLDIGKSSIRVIIK